MLIMLGFTARALPHTDCTPRATGQSMQPMSNTTLAATAVRPSVGTAQLDTYMLEMPWLILMVSGPPSAMLWASVT
jgi:hypothetical protein